MHHCLLLLVWISFVQALLVDKPPRNEIGNPITIHPNQAPRLPPTIFQEPPTYFKNFHLDSCLAPENLNSESADCQRRRRVFFLSSVWRSRLGLRSLSEWRTHYHLQPLNVAADPTTRTGLGFLRDLGPSPRKLFHLVRSKQLHNLRNVHIRQYDANSEYAYFPDPSASPTDFKLSFVTGKCQYFLDSPLNAHASSAYEPATVLPVSTNFSYSHQSGIPASGLAQELGTLQTSDASHHPSHPIAQDSRNTSTDLSVSGVSQTDQSSGQRPTRSKHVQSGSPRSSPTDASFLSGYATTHVPRSQGHARDNKTSSPLARLRQGAVPTTLAPVPTSGSGVQPTYVSPLQSSHPLATIRNETVHDSTSSADPFQDLPATHSHPRVKRSPAHTFKTMIAYDCSDPLQTTAIKTTHMIDCPMANQTPDLNTRNVSLTLLQTTGFYKSTAFRFRRVRSAIPMYCTTHSHQTMAIELLSIANPVTTGCPTRTVTFHVPLFSANF